MNPFEKINAVLREPKHSQWTGAQVTIQFRVKDRGAWRKFEVTKDYVAAAMLPRFNKDKWYEFRIRP